MSYRTLAVLGRDDNILARIVACTSTQGEADPFRWALERRWALSSQSGWDAAYASALTAGTPNPGNSETVITDNMILSAVQSIMTAEAAE